ncbi:MAG TPA: hypothetical protein VIW64_03750 [Pyrinomonadaceae bacterium]|jgi:hypothetical protein
MEFREQTGFTGMYCPKSRFSRSALGREFELAFCEQFIGQLRVLEHDLTIRDSSDVCGARVMQFEQEFRGPFLGETMSAHNWRDHVGNFCVAEYLAEHYMVLSRRE